MTVVVFTGPTLRPKEAETLLDATYLGPAAQGDIYRASQHRPTAIGLIDGLFDRVPSVWHKEILWAMSQGIHVYGSASMGALRAAELEAFGMVGVGRIFEAFRDGELEDDDEVAILHTDEEHGYRPLSEAMVSVRATLEEAQAQNVIDGRTREQIESVAKELHFPERSWETILGVAVDQEEAGNGIEKLRRWLPAGGRDQKRLDALTMLKRIDQDLRTLRGPKQVHFSFEYTYSWDRVVRTCHGLRPPGPRTPSDDSSELMLDEVRLKGPVYYRALLRAALGRLLAVEEGHRLGAAFSTEEIEVAASGICSRYGLEHQADLDDWLKALELDRDSSFALVQEEALLRRAVRDRTTALGFHLLGELRARGEYAHLRETTKKKKETLERAGLDNPSVSDLQVSFGDVLSWYFEEKLGLPLPRDLLQHARESGFESEAAFSLAVVREYCLHRVASVNQSGNGGNR